MPAEQRAEAPVRKPRRVEISPLGISITNLAEVTDGFCYLYLSDDPALGKFELTLKAIDQTLGITGASALELYIPADMQTAEQLKRVRLSAVSATLWQLARIDGGLRLTLQSGKSLQVIKDLPVKIGLEGMLATGETEIKRDLTFSWISFQGIDDDYRVFDFRRILFRRVHATIECKWLPREEYFEDGGAFVYYTPYAPTTQLPGIPNRLILFIENKGDALTGENAEFSVTFPTEMQGDTQSALCFSEQLKVVGCTRYGAGRAWRVSRIEDGEVVSWKFQRPQDGKAVLTARETVTFEFTNLVTELKNGTVQAQLHWSSLEKVSSGYVSTSIMKRPPAPYLRELYVKDAAGRRLTPAEKIYCGETYKLCWDAFATDRFEIESPPRPKVTVTSFLEFTADQKNKTFTVTPQIGNKNGMAGNISMDLRETEAKLTQKPVKVDGLDCVQLEWETRGGVASLGSIRTSRTNRSASGTETVRANDAYTLRVDTLGQITERILGVTVPLCTIEPKVEWEAAGPFATLEWKGINATSCEVAFLNPSNSQKFEIGLPVSCRIRFNAEDYRFVAVKLTSSQGTCTWYWVNAAFGIRPVLPSATFQETVETLTGKLQVKWKVNTPLAYFSYDDTRTKLVEQTKTSMEFTRDFVAPYVVTTYLLAAINGADFVNMTQATLTEWCTGPQRSQLAEKSPMEIMQYMEEIVASTGKAQGQQA